MHIVFLNTLYAPHDNTGGAEATLRFLARQLADRGHRCTVVSLTPKQSWIGEIDGLTVHYVKLANVYWPHAGKRPKILRPVFQLLDAYNPVMRRRLQRLLARLRPDVIHAHNLQGFSVSAWVAARRLGIPVVQTLHDYYLACPRSTMWRPDRGNCASPCLECRIFATPRRRLSHLPAIVTSVSHRVLQRVSAAGVFRDAETRIIRGNNAAEQIAPLVPRPATGVLRLGFLGRLDPVKGIEMLLQAVGSLPPGKVSLRIAGRGQPDYEAALRQAVIPGTDVQFLGHVAPGSFFTDIDLLVAPSVWEDPFPRVWHEALQYGVPCLVMPLGGLPEAIIPGQTGFVAPSADADGVRATLQTLLAQGWDQTAMRQACLAAAEDYRPSRIVDQYEAALSAAGRRAA